jgi:hypothetical protein
MKYALGLLVLFVSCGKDSTSVNVANVAETELERDRVWVPGSADSTSGVEVVYMGVSTVSIGNNNCLAGYTANPGVFYASRAIPLILGELVATETFGCYYSGTGVATNVGGGRREADGAYCPVNDENGKAYAYPVYCWKQCEKGAC